MRRPAAAPAAGFEAAVARAATEPGQPLPRDVRETFERSLGAGLAKVRVHTGAESATAAQAVGARAYTVGESIHFAAGEYAPSTAEGRRLLAHEVVHTQQRADVSGVSAAGSAAEVEADTLAAALTGLSPRTRLPVAERPALARKEQNRILYVGLNPNAISEAKALYEKTNGGVAIVLNSQYTEGIVVDGSYFDLRGEFQEPTPSADVPADESPFERMVREGRQTLPRRDEWLGDTFLRSLDLKPAIVDEVRSLIRAAAPSKNEMPGIDDELAQIIRFYSLAERGKITMGRVVLSGDAGSGIGILGRGNATLPFETLKKLAVLFPLAAGQVRDLMLAGCNTGWRRMIPTYREMFPLVRTIRGYVGHAPLAGEDMVPGEAEKDLLAWEEDTRDRHHAGGGTKGTNQALWTAEGGYQGRNRTVAEIRKDIESPESSFKAILAGERDTNENDEDLLHYAQYLNELADALPEERPQLERQIGVVVRLRHYREVAAAFMAVHGATISAGYKEAKLRTPDYGNWARSMALKRIAQLTDLVGGKEEGTKAGPKAKKALDLLQHCLRDLDPDPITGVPFEWVVHGSATSRAR